MRALNYLLLILNVNIGLRLCKATPKCEYWNDIMLRTSKVEYIVAAHIYMEAI